jgi:tryptophan synthase alpha chain
MSSGVQRIGEAFAEAREEGRAALMPYMMGGFPDPGTAKEIAKAYCDSGATLIELGIPFSDPLADGPVIHAAATQALASGATFESALEACDEVSDRVPVVVMCYANMMIGDPQRFAMYLNGAGAAGAIVPDLPQEESAAVKEALAAYGLALIPLIAPTTPAERRRRISEGALGFVYLVSTAGVTGEREGLPPELTDLIAAAKSESAVPVAVGFGISNPDQVAAVGEVADGVIIGTRLVRAVADAPDASSAVDAVTEFLGSAGEALRR